VFLCFCEYERGTGGVNNKKGFDPPPAVPAAVCRWGLCPRCPSAGVGEVSLGGEHIILFVIEQPQLSDATKLKPAPPIGLYTILLLPIMQGVWHIQREVEGSHIFPNSRAMVLQQCGQCRRAGRIKG